MVVVFLRHFTSQGHSLSFLSHKGFGEVQIFIQPAPWEGGKKNAYDVTPKMGFLNDVFLSRQECCCLFCSLWKKPVHARSQQHSRGDFPAQPSIEADKGAKRVSRVERWDGKTWETC